MAAENHRRIGGVIQCLAVVFLFLTVGCNNSRYGLHYNERLPGIKRVGVIAPSIRVFSLHTGGVQEERPDMIPAVQERVVAAIVDEVRRCNLEPVVMDVSAPTTQPADSSKTGQLALLAAVSQSIVIHHYLHGKERTIDYATGDAPSVLGCDDVDALLCVDVQGVVPTTGREILQGTAIVMGVLTGIHIYVATKQATVALMIVDRKTGEVLWFNAAMKEIKVSNEHDFRNLCRDASKYMFKPRE